MNPLTTLYERLRQRGAGSVPPCIEQPPLLADWLRYWNEGDTELGNLHNFGHWLSRSRAVRAQQPRIRPRIERSAAHR